MSGKFWVYHLGRNNTECPAPADLTQNDSWECRNIYGYVLQDLDLEGYYAIQLPPDTCPAPENLDPNSQDHNWTCNEVTAWNYPDLSQADYDYIVPPVLLSRARRVGLQHQLGMPALDGLQDQ